MPGREAKAVYVVAVWGFLKETYTQLVAASGAKREADALADEMNAHRNGAPYVVEVVKVPTVKEYLAKAKAAKE